MWLKASKRVPSLYDLRRAHYAGNAGKHGRGQVWNGPKGKDIFVSVPIGTEIFEINSVYPISKDKTN